MRQAENHESLTGNLIPGSGDFATYRGLSPTAVAVEVFGRLTVFIPPIIVWLVYKAFLDEAAAHEDWLGVYVQSFQIVLAILLCRCVWRLVHGFLFARSYRYMFDDAGIHVLEGVCARQHHTVPRNRIQRVNVAQGMLQRANALATLTILTAGTTPVGNTVQHLPIELANRVKDEIVEQANANAST